MKEERKGREVSAITSPKAKTHQLRLTKIGKHLPFFG